MAIYGDVYGVANVSNVPQEGALAGQIAIELIVGDDYLGSRALAWTVEIPDDCTVALSSCDLKFVQCSGACTPFEITFDGTITAGDAGYAVLSFAMPKAETATITAGEYQWFVIWTGDAGQEITKVYSKQVSQIALWQDRSV